MTEAQKKALQFLTELGGYISREDSRGTHNPIWQVREIVVQWGIDPDYDHQEKMYKHNGEEVSEETEKLLEHMEIMDCDLPPGYDIVYGRRTERVVQSFLTEVAADNYITANKHNLNEPFTYVESLYRNHQMIEIRGLAKRLWEEDQASKKSEGAVTYQPITIIPAERKIADNLYLRVWEAGDPYDEECGFGGEIYDATEEPFKSVCAEEGDSIDSLLDKMIRALGEKEGIDPAVIEAIAEIVKATREASK